MKRLAVLILAFLYLGTSSGATVNIHYCMGNFAGWDIGQDIENKCGTCGMEKDPDAAKNNCCKDEHKIIKVNDDHKSAELFADFIQVSAAPIVFSNTFLIHTPPTVTETYPVVNAPPGDGSKPTFLFIRSIRI